MPDIYPQYSVTTIHGERQTLFKVVKQKSADERDWEDVQSFPSRKVAEDMAANLNSQVKVNHAS